MKRRNQRGLSLVELIVACAILAVLSMLALPLASMKIRTERQRDLRYALTQMRTAIDKYKDNCDQGFFGPPKIGSNCYPESLDILVEGMKLAQDPNGTKLKFLRRIPRDPFTNKFEWGMRSTEDDPKSKSWGGQAVFEVFTKSEEKAPDGTPYSEW
ncbi:MAG: type II secretion system protein [Bryobacteraceae bacterium]